MKLYICNAFSLSMLDRDDQRGTPEGYTPVAADLPGRSARIPRPVTNPSAFLGAYREVGAEIVSAVGHADVARLISEILDYPVEVDRSTVKLGSDEVVLVGQYIGPRFPEGATELPKGARLEWWAV